MKNFLVLFIFILLSSTCAWAQEAILHVHISAADLQKLIESMPSQMIYDSTSQTFEVRSFQFQEVLSNIVKFKCYLYYELRQKFFGKWRKIFSIGIWLHVQARVIYQDDCYHFSLQLSQLPVRIPNEFRQPLLAVLNSLLKTTFGRIEANRPDLGGKLRLDIGSPLPGQDLAESFFSPNSAVISNLLKNYASKEHAALKKIGLLYRDGRFAITRPIRGANGEIFEFVAGNLSFPSLQTEKKRMLLHCALSFEAIHVKQAGNNEKIPGGQINIILPVDWDNSVHKQLSLQLLEDGKRLFSSRNPVLDIVATAIYLSYKKQIGEAVKSCKIPHRALKISFNMNGSAKIFAFLAAKIHQGKIFFLYSLK